MVMLKAIRLNSKFLMQLTQALLVMQAVFLVYLSSTALIWEWEVSQLSGLIILAKMATFVMAEIIKRLAMSYAHLITTVLLVTKFHAHLANSSQFKVLQAQMNALTVLPERSAQLLPTI